MVANLVSPSVYIYIFKLTIDFNKTYILKSNLYPSINNGFSI